ncbi:MAG TPA: fumarate hydratase [Gammaproteobacteria bacterium]|nr:fumarate hydratase [Gammaproteobacteria bacterium]
MEDKKRQGAPRLDDPNAIEADIAYFDARIAFASRGEQTAYKAAQRKACEALSRSLSEVLERLRR